MSGKDARLGDGGHGPPYARVGRSRIVGCRAFGVYDAPDVGRSENIVGCTVRAGLPVHAVRMTHRTCLVQRPVAGMARFFYSSSDLRISKPACSAFS